MEHRSRGVKLAIWAIVLALFAVGVAACGGDDAAAPAEPEEPLSLAFFQIASVNAYAQVTQQGAEQAASDLNASVDVFDAVFDPTAQLGQVRDAIVTGKYDGFVIFAVDGNSIVPAVEEALEAGIKVSGVFTPFGPNFLDVVNEVGGVTTIVGVSERDVALSQAQMTIDLCEGKDPCNVVYLPGILAFPPSAGRFEIYKEEIAGHPNITIVATQEAGFEANAAVTAMQNILQANQDIDVVATDGDQMSFGAEQAINDAGLTDQIQITGNGGGELGLSAIREGRWAGTVYSPPFDMGAKAVELLVLGIQGEEVPETFDFFDIQRENDQGPIITAKNVDNVEAQWPG
jgi:ribose transport system substrate-binding protein